MYKLSLSWLDSRSVWLNSLPFDISPTCARWVHSWRCSTQMAEKRRVEENVAIDHGHQVWAKYFYISLYINETYLILSTFNWIISVTLTQILWSLDLSFSRRYLEQERPCNGSLFRSPLTDVRSHKTSRRRHIVSYSNRKKKVFKRFLIGQVHVPPRHGCHLL